MEKADKDQEFVQKFKEFYTMFFSCISDSVTYLADIQEAYKKQYQKILDFSNDIGSIEELLNKLPAEKQTILLRTLLKAGEFGRKFASLMEMSAKEKKSFAKDLKDFSKDLKEM